VDEALLDLVVGEAGQVVAGLVEADSAQCHFSDLELSADEVVEGDVAGDDVAAGVAGAELELVVTLQRLDRLDLDKGDLAVGSVPVRVGAFAVEVPVALQPLPRDCVRLFQGYGGFARDRSDVYRIDCALKHVGGAFPALLDGEHSLQGDVGVAAGVPGIISESPQKALDEIKKLTDDSDVGLVLVSDDISESINDELTELRAKKSTLVFSLPSIGSEKTQVDYRLMLKKILGV